MDEAEIKVVIKGILGSSQTAMTQSELHKFFNEFTGGPIPYKRFGFRNCQDYLQSLTDTCILSGSGAYATVTGVLSNNSAHIVNMIAKQRPMRGPRRRPRNHVLLTENTSIKPQHHRPPRFQNKPTQNNSLFQSKSHEVRRTNFDNFDFLPLNSAIPKVNTPPSLPVNGNDNYKNHVNTISVTNEDSDESWDELVPENKALNILPAASSTSSSSFDHNINYKVPHEVQENLKQLIKKFPDGLWLSKLPEEYKKLFGVDLDFLKYKYPTLAQMCASLSYIFVYKHLRKDGGKLYDVNKPIPEDPCGELLKLEEQIVCPTEAHDPNIKAIPESIFCNDDVMQLGDTIPVEKMDLEKLYTPVMIGEVYDLSKFWFILADNEKILETLEADLESFYNAKYKNYEIPENLIQKGLFVVLYKAPAEYYRAVIVKVLRSVVKVFCVDSGMVMEAIPSNIYLLHKQFTKIPRQGLRGRLSGLLPPCKQQQWSRDASYRFLQLVKESTLFGSVAEVDDTQSDLIYELVLCDSSSDDDVFIHDVLLRENFAVATEQEQRINEHLYDDYVCIVDNLHLYPTFYELEEHLVPNAMEMRRLVSYRVPIYHIYSQYFKLKTSIEIDNPLKLFVNRLAKNIEAEQVDCSQQTSDIEMNKNNEEEDTTTTDIEANRKSNNLSPCSSKDSGNINSPLSDETNIENNNLEVITTTSYNVSPPSTPIVITQANLGPPPGFNYPITNYQNNYSNSYPNNFSAAPYNFQQLLLRNAYWQCQQQYYQDQLARQQATNINSYQQQLYQSHMPNNSMYGQIPRDNRQNYSNNPYIPKQNPVVDVQTAFNLNVIQEKMKNLVIDTKVNTTPTLQVKTPLKKAKRNVILQHLEEEISIHVILIMDVPSVIPLEIQKVFTGKENIVFLRRYLNLGEITTGELRLDRISDKFREELLKENLIKTDQICLEYTNFTYLPELIKCIINDDYKVPGFETLLKTLSTDSPIWYS